MRKTLATLLILLTVLSNRAEAQLGLSPTTFSPGQTISSSTFTSLFTTISSNACNRTGCTFTGTVLFSSDNSHDIGASGATRPRDLFLGRNAVVGGTLGVTGASTFAAISGTTGTFSSTLGVSGATSLAALSATTGSFSSTLAATTLTLSNTGATSISTAGGITAGSGTVGIVDTSGKIPAISSTYFASLSGGNLTGILESAITDSTILSRVADTETFSGAKTFTANPTISNTQAQLLISDTNSGSNEKNWILQVDNSQLNLASATDATPGTAVTTAMEIGRSGTSITYVEFRSSVRETGAQSASTTSGDNTITLNTDTILLRITTGSTASNNNLAGITGGANGRRLDVCRVGGTDAMTTESEDTGATAANRLLFNASSFSLSTNFRAEDCMQLRYDGTTSRWRVIGSSAG